MKKFFPTEHRLNRYFFNKSFFFLFSLFFSFNLLGQNATNGGIIATNQEICPGEIPELIEGIIPASGGGNTSIEYLWMTTTQGNLGISNWDIASGNNNQEDYLPPIPGQTTYYVRCARRQGFSEYIAETNIVTIKVLNSPTAIINGNPGTTFIGTTVNFSAATAFNGTYSWDFNGDGIIDCTGQNCSYTYNSTGTFTVTLTVSNGDCIITTSEPIVIQNPYVNGISDPCTCTDPLNFYDTDDYFVHDYILINSSPNETWTLSNMSLGNLYNNAGNLLPIGTVIPETSPGTYYLDVWFISGEGFSGNVSNGTSTLSTGTTDPCNCFNPLPIELLSFEGFINNKKITLKWVTSSETDNSHFEIERSLDGNRFDFVGSIQGQGNSSTNQYYSLIDENTISGVTYYRLKQIDFDGTYTYSHIIAMEIETDNSIVAVIPNPISDEALVRFGANLPNDSELEVYSAIGKRLQVYPISDSSQKINLKKLDKGIYFLRIKRGYKNLGKFFKIAKL